MLSNFKNIGIKFIVISQSWAQFIAIFQKWFLISEKVSITFEIMFIYILQIGS